MTLLLDTCAAIWIAEDQISPGSEQVLEDTRRRSESIVVSAITAWELGMLMAKGRLASPLDPLTWFRRFTASNLVEVFDLTPDVLVASSYLPGEPPRDPADRIIISTAREHDLQLMTRDQQILDYAQAGHVQVVAC